ncbi:MAG: ATP-binding protein [Noviherbaspirillum sp.]
MKSISRQLLLMLLGGVLACTLIAAVAGYLNVRDEADDLFDLQLQQLAAAMPAEFPPQAAVSEDDELDDDFVVQVWDGSGRLLYASAPEQLLPRVAGAGFSTVSAAGERWRVYAQSRHGRSVQIAQQTSVRGDLAAGLAWNALLPYLLLLPVMAAVIGLVVYRGLAPLRRLALAVGRRSPDALHPLAPEPAPAELQPIIHAINALLGKLERALAMQRAFVADAAHELRTPLTALKLQLQLAERAESHAQRAAAFGKLHQRLDRSTRLVQQLLTLAREEPEAMEVASEDVDLAELARQVVAECSALAEEKHIDLGCGAGAQAAIVRGRRHSLHTLLGNLVDNAIRYTPEGGRIDVQTEVLHGRAAWRVADDGPGIPAVDRERVFDRFFRREGSGAGGSGLGMAIVRRIAENHGATVRLEDNPGGAGLAVQVLF